MGFFLLLIHHIETVTVSFDEYLVDIAFDLELNPL